MDAERLGRQEIIEQLPESLQLLMTLERFHLHNADYFFGRTTVDRRYLPQNCGPFRLPCFWIPRRYFYVYGHQSAATPEFRILDDHSSHATVLYPVHPLYLERYQEFLSRAHARDATLDGLCIWAVPTASTRTLLAWPHQQPDKALFLKVSLHHELMGVRRLDKVRVAHSVGVSALVQHTVSDLPRGLGYLPEAVGFVPRLMPDSGVIVRSIPQEVKASRLVLAPLFSLLGSSGTRRPFLCDVVERSGRDARQVLESVIYSHFARLWLTMSLHFGLLLETHGQDLLLALSSQLQSVKQFYYRDFEGTMVDWELRRRLGLPDCPDMPVAGSWRETYTMSNFSRGNLITQQMEWSLRGFLHFILKDVDAVVDHCCDVGWLKRSDVTASEATMVFSCQMFQALHDIFGVRPTTQYNIYHDQRRFIKTLFNLRREVLRSTARP